MKLLEILAYITIVVVIGFFVWTSCANAADYAIVSFNDPEHLAALQDSVVGVCDTVLDTTWGFITVQKSRNRTDPGTPDSLRVGVVYVEGHIRRPGLHRYLIATSTITCRRLVGVTVTLLLEIAGSFSTSAEGSGKILYTPGKAIIFYESYKEEQ